MIFIILTLWSLFTYFFLRLHFLIWNWNFFSHQSLGEIAWAFLQGLRFDLSAISILNLLPGLLFFGATFLPKKWFLRLVYGAIMPLTLVLHAVFLIFNLNDSKFIHFLGRRFTFDSIYLIKEMQGKTGDLIASYWELNLINGCFLIFVFMILIYTLRKWIHGVSQKMELKKDLDNQNKVSAKNNTLS